MTEKSLFSGMVPVTRPYFDEAEERVLIEAVRSGWVAQGPRVKAFERAVAEYVQVPYAVALNSCTSALQIALEILGVGPGDEVILPSFTFIATANAVVHRGAVPVFADIDPATYNIDPDDIEGLITEKTKVILPVDQVGLPADLEPILEIAKRRRLRILEDAACALGSTYEGRPVGGISEISCFSFHPRKVITTGEGGMITTREADLAAHAWMLASHGASVSDLARHQSESVVIEEYPVFGYNYRMSDLQAAVGLAQLQKLDEILAKKRFWAERYHEAFASMEEVEIPFEPEGVKSNFQSYLLRFRSDAGRRRDEIMNVLKKKGVATRRGVMAIHLESSYRNRFGYKPLPETEKAARETITLPLYPQMTVEEQSYVVDCIKEALART